MTHFLRAQNFSGRTSFLKDFTGFDDSSVKSGIYLGELPNNFISGLATTVEHELILHRQRKNFAKSESIELFCKKILFEKLMQKSPFELSGGEQAMLVILSGLMYVEDNLAIDTTLEQLDNFWRSELLKLLDTDIIENINIKISDNRLADYGTENLKVFENFELSDYDARKLNIHKVCFQHNNFDIVPSDDLDIAEISFGYSKKIQVLKSCSFKFLAGNIYHLKGANGSGKSTLAKILSGLYKPSGGSVFQKGAKQNLYKYPGALIRYCFQNPDDQIFSNTVLTVLKGADKKISTQAQKRISYFSEIFGLQDLLTHHPADLPFTLRKRLTIAAALISDRPWYIFDEPTIGQDDETVEELAKLFQSLIAKGKGVIVVSHSEYLISKFKNIITVTIKDGKLNPA